MRVSKPSLGSISQELYEPVTEGKHCLTPPPSLRRAMFLLSLLLALPSQPYYTRPPPLKREAVKSKFQMASAFTLS